MRAVKKIIQRLFSFFGLKISRMRPGILTEENRFKWLQALEIRTVIDIGASKGNASWQFHQLFPTASIYAFEPLQDCFNLMIKKMEGVPKFQAFNLALSDEAGETSIFRSSYSGSSSLLPMGQLHKDTFPQTAGQRRETIQTDTLDHALEKQKLQENILIKIDVQGLEDRVLRGGLKTLARTKVVVLETSYVSLYDGQPLFDDIYKVLVNLGFVYVGLWGEDFHSPQDGRPLQQDSIFIRESS
ncbi:MAG: FkbM family methyltransferase [bacterium]|nr:FkbM family methyltransferase [bacterium]